MLVHFFAPLPKLHPLLPPFLFSFLNSFLFCFFLLPHFLFLLPFFSSTGRKTRVGYQEWLEQGQDSNGGSKKNNQPNKQKIKAADWSPERGFVLGRNIFWSCKIFRREVVQPAQDLQESDRGE